MISLKGIFRLLAVGMFRAEVIEVSRKYSIQTQG
jgi:hypothetical protein